MYYEGENGEIEKVFNADNCFTDFQGKDRFRTCDDEDGTLVNFE